MFEANNLLKGMFPSSPIFNSTTATAACLFAAVCVVVFVVMMDTQWNELHLHISELAGCYIGVFF